MSGSPVSKFHSNTIMPGSSSNAKSAKGRLPIENLNYRKKTGRLLAHIEHFVNKTRQAFLSQIEWKQTQKIRHCVRLRIHCNENRHMTNCKLMS